MKPQHVGPPRSMLLFEAGSILPAIAMMVLSPELGGIEDLLWLIAWVALTLWVSRGRSSTARLLYTALMILQGALLTNAYFWNDVEPWDYAILFGNLTLGATLLTMLWWPSTTVWLRKPRTT